MGASRSSSAVILRESAVRAASGLPVFYLLILWLQMFPCSLERRPQQITRPRRGVEINLPRIRKRSATRWEHISGLYCGGPIPLVRENPGIPAETSAEPRQSRRTNLKTD